METSKLPMTSINPLTSSKLSRRLLGALSLTVASLLPTSTVVLADINSTSDDVRWYQVELFIFAHNDRGAEIGELWPRQLNLKYPRQLIALNPPIPEATLPENIELPLQDSLSNESLVVEQQVGTLAATAQPSSDPSAVAMAFDQAPASQDPSNTDSSGLEHVAALPIKVFTGPLPAELAAVADLQPDQEQPFMFLPEDQHQLSAIAARISRQNDFRLLFHQRWNQPMVDRQQASHLLIRAGQQFDSHFELEGSIKLSVERYLHLDTDLWLSRFIDKNQITTSPWPKLPTVPLSFDLTPANNDVGSLAAASPLSQFNHRLLDEFLLADQQLFSVERTVTMRQHRRMRSQEIHYIDHPLMGILLKIVRYDEAPTALPQPIIEEPLGSAKELPSSDTSNNPSLVPSDNVGDPQASPQ